MTSYVERRHLSTGGLRLILRNESGQMQDARYVRWTIYDLPARRQISGRGLSAVHRNVGQYYAPWYTDVQSGSYEIEWEFQRDHSSAVERKRWPFFIVQESSYECCPNRVCPNGVPAPGGFTFLAGTCLHNGDLPLYLKDDNGFLTDAYMVRWTVFRSDGCPVTAKTDATKLSTGVYSADWIAIAVGGDYWVEWEFQEAMGLPLQSTRLHFTLVCAANPTMGVADGQWACDVHAEPYERMPLVRTFSSGAIVCTSSVTVGGCGCS